MNRMSEFPTVMILACQCIRMLTIFLGMFFVHLFLMPALMVEQASHYRISLNQAYMAAAMSAAMMFTVHHNMSMQSVILYIAILVAAIVAIRTQLFVTDSQYLNEMIQHHSMALLTSRPRLARTKNPEVAQLADQIIRAQEKEIATMKNIA